MKLTYIIITLIILTFTNCNGPNTFNYIDLNDKNGNFLCKLNPVDSTAIIYIDNERTYMTGKLVNQQREGFWNEYITKNDELDFKWSYKNDIREGRYFGYYSTGKIQTIGYYKDDGLNGPLVYFDLKGRAEKVELWEGNGGCSILLFSKDLRVKIDKKK